MVTHQWGGGTERHIKAVIDAVSGSVNVVILRIIESGLELTIPAMPDKPMKLMERERDFLLGWLRAFEIDRMHMHQIIGQESILRWLIDGLAVPFDWTVHDYYLICPQMHLHEPNVFQYCGELGEEQCNRCIAWNDPFGARDIREWRTGHAWFAENAARVICPSKDVKSRVARYFPRANLIVVPHEPNPVDSWTVKAHPVSSEKPLRVLLIGTLTALKGRQIVEACLRESAGTPIEFMLIGTTQPPFSSDIAERFAETGAYKESELSGRLKELAPHVVWFPQPTPETYSYTLTAAIDSGLPIAASRIGALPERLEGRPLTWLVDAAAPAAKWLATFRSIKDELSAAALSPQTGKRARVEAYYPGGYLKFSNLKALPPP